MNIILIPAYKPNIETIKLIKSLNTLNNCKILLVNNGCPISYLHYFEEIEKNNYAEIINKDFNNGKGAGIKFGLKYLKKNYKTINNIIFADCDGQHTKEDIDKFIYTFKETKKDFNFYIGKRQFSLKNPKKNYFGNKIFNFLMKVFHKIDIDDCLCGLRAINYNLIDILININANEFDYEIISLIRLKKGNIKMKQITIPATYLKDNKSNFKSFIDSIKLILSIFKQA